MGFKPGGDSNGDAVLTRILTFNLKSNAIGFFKARPDPGTAALAAGRDHAGDGARALEGAAAVCLAQG